jgi:hypothetical protein
MRFSVPTGIQEDSGFLKVFVSTQYANMDNLCYHCGQDDQHSILARPDAERVATQSPSHWNAWTYVITVKSRSKRGLKI